MILLILKLGFKKISFSPHFEGSFSITVLVLSLKCVWGKVARPSCRKGYITVLILWDSSASRGKVCEHFVVGSEKIVESPFFSTADKCPAPQVISNGFSSLQLPCCHLVPGTTSPTGRLPEMDSLFSFLSCFLCTKSLLQNA